MPVVQTEGAIVMEDGGMTTWSPTTPENAAAIAEANAELNPTIRYAVVPVAVYKFVEEETP